MKTMTRLLVLILVAALLLAGCAGNANNNTADLNQAPAEETALPLPETGANAEDGLDATDEAEILPTAIPTAGEVVDEVEEGPASDVEVVETPTADGAAVAEEPGAAAEDGADVIDSDNFTLVSDLLGRTVYSPQGEELGVIADLAFDDLTDYVAYVILEPGADLEVDSELVAIPWAALGSAEPFPGEQEGAFRSFTYELDPALLSGEPGFSKAELEEQGLELWSPELYDYWAANSDNNLVAGFSDATVLTQLSGYEEFVVIQGGTEEAFPVQDVLIGLSTGSVAYFIVPADQLPFGGDGLALIPFSYLTYEIQEDGTTGYVFAEGEDVPEHFQYLSEEEFEALR